MKKIVGIIVIILMIPFVIYVIADIDRTPIYPTTEFSIIDKPSDKQLLSNDKLLYQLPNTVYFTTNELPEYVEYYENGILEVDSGILSYTIDDNLAYINYIEGEITQVVDGEFIVSKPTQIISKSNNLFDINATPSLLLRATYTLLPNGIKVKANSASTFNRVHYTLIVKPNTTYTFTTNVSVITGGNNITITDSNNIQIVASASITPTLTFTSPSDGIIIIRFYCTTDTPVLGEVDYTNIQLNEGTTALPYQPFAEHIYNLGNSVELYKLPNGVGDIWYQDGTLERNVGVIDTVNNYAEYGTLPTGTYDNTLEFINNNQNKQIKIFFDDIIQESRYNTYLENDTIIINNDTEVIRIYNDDTYTSTRNLDTNITYKLEGYNILEYIDGEFDNTVLAFFWIIPVLLVGGLIFLLIGKRKE